MHDHNVYNTDLVVHNTFQKREMPDLQKSHPGIEYKL